MDRDPASVPLAELDLLWDFDDPAGSELRFSELVRRARSEHGGAFLPEVLTQLARARGLQRRFDQADATLDDAEALLRPDDARGRVRVHLERGRVANTAGREGRGRTAFLDAWDLARATGEDALAVDAAHMLGIVEPGDEGWEWNERAMELACGSDDPRCAALGRLAGEQHGLGAAQRGRRRCRDRALRALAGRLPRRRADRPRTGRALVDRPLPPRPRGRREAARRAGGAPGGARRARRRRTGTSSRRSPSACSRSAAARRRGRTSPARTPPSNRQTFLASDEPERLERLRSLGGA